MRKDIKKVKRRASKRDVLKDVLRDVLKAQDRRVSTLPKECWRTELTLRQFQN